MKSSLGLAGKDFTNGTVSVYERGNSLLISWFLLMQVACIELTISIILLSIMAIGEIKKG